VSRSRAGTKNIRSRDGHSISYDRVKATLDLIMIETFGETIESISGEERRSGPVVLREAFRPAPPQPERKMED
jgi:hypothetical protein